MHPILLDWNGIVLPAWHVMFALGALAAWGVLAWLRPRVMPSVSIAHLAEAYVAGYVGGYFGARLFSIVVEENSGGSVAGFAKALFSLGPMTFYGGALGGALAACGYAVWRKLPKRRVLDAAIPALLVALGIGRIGCFLNGCDYGCVTDSGFFSVVPPVMGDGLPRVPVQLFESLFSTSLGLFLAGVLWKCPDRFSPGIVGYKGIAAYSVFRFVIEYSRCDDRGWVVTGMLSPAQAVSIGLLVFIAATWPLIRKQEHS